MNTITRQCIANALAKDRKLPARKLEQIQSAALSCWYDFLTLRGHDFWLRAVQLYYQFRPECVTLELRDQGYVDCDECSERLSEAVGHYLESWWVRQHPEYDYQEFTAEEAAAVFAEMGREREAEQARAEAERMRVGTYQIAMF